MTAFVIRKCENEICHVAEGLHNVDEFAFHESVECVPLLNVEEICIDRLAVKMGRIADERLGTFDFARC